MRLLSIFFNFQNYRQEILKNIFLHHYRYESEGRSAGTLLGRNATNKTKTYPTLKIIGFQVHTIYNIWGLKPTLSLSKGYRCEISGFCLLSFSQNERT